MSLLSILQPATPPAPRGARKVTKASRPHKRHHRLIFTPAQVNVIKELYSQGFGYRLIAKCFRASPSCIRYLIKGNTESYR